MRKQWWFFVMILVLAGLSLGPAPKDQPPEDETLYGHYETFAQIVARIQSSYVEPVAPEKLFEGAFQGVTSVLDPYSQYLSPEDAAQLRIGTKGEFGGLGIEITLDEDRVLTVITPLEGSPAFKAGVRAGDRILKVDGVSTKGLTLRGAVKKLRGKKGSKVVIQVAHEEDGSTEEITIVRDIIKLKSIAAQKLLDEKTKIGYIRVTHFQQRTDRDLRVAVDGLLAQEMKGLILDLRFNPGGILEAAVGASDLFLSSGVVVRTRGRMRGASKEYLAHEPGTYPDFPLVVLITKRSASGSEIVAGALKDNQRATIVGTRSFGKGSVQTFFNLEGGKAGLKLTTAKFYTPSGRSILRDWNNPEQEEWGIEPDIVVPVTVKEEVRLVQQWRREHILKAPKEAEEPEEAPKKEEAKEAPFVDRQLETARVVCQTLIWQQERKPTLATKDAKK